MIVEYDERWATVKRSGDERIYRVMAFGEYDLSTRYLAVIKKATAWVAQILAGVSFIHP